MVILIGALLLALLPVGVSAQTIDGAASPRFIFGPLGVTPRIALKDVGIDSNPRNQAENPERDFTATLVPGVDTYLRIGRGRLTGKTSVEYLYFSKLDEQRSFNFNQELRAEVVLNRVAPFVAAGYLRTRQRPNLEIDTRVQQKTRFAGGGTTLRLGSKTSLELEARRVQLTYGDGTYGDPLIAQALDRDSDALAWTSKVVLTPLTTFAVRAESRRDRFKFNPIRSSDSVSVLPGFQFKPSALIAGKVSAGFRRFDAIDASVPDFSGLIGELDASYTWQERTRFGFKASRDVEYSVEDIQPYFVANGGGLEITQIIGLNWFAVARGSRTRLVYRNYIGGLVPVGEIGRSDRVDTYGAGFGRRLGDDVRVSLDVNKVRRLSTVPSRQYEGYRVGVSISYGS
jgi:hypothetical protein